MGEGGRARDGARGSAAADRGEGRAASPRVLSAAAVAGDPRPSSASATPPRATRRSSCARSTRPRLPERVAQEARRETERLRALSPASSEYQVLRNYVEWVLALPWHARSGDEDIALEKVEAALDSRHYGLEEAKERILEYLSVRKLLKQSGGHSHGPILCFVGPPGTGKTSLGEAIAESIGRAFYRISVGGVRDEAEIRGHRRTYVGSLPGLILQALRRVQVCDPVLMIDEIDKMQGGGPSGDPLCRDARGARPAAERSRLSITISTCRSTSGRCCSSAPRTTCSTFHRRCATAWRSSASRGTPSRRRSRSRGATCCRGS